MTEWISVERRLPDNSGYYMVCLNKQKPHNICSDFYCESPGYFDHPYGVKQDLEGKPENHFRMCREYGYEITHWMPLPQPPKEKK